MQGMQDGSCPFEFNFKPETFKVGDLVSYRVPSLGDFPFVGKIVSVSADEIGLTDAGEPGDVLRASRIARPVVLDEAPLKLGKTA